MASSTTVWRGRRVFVTGHTGFKGSWLTLWLHQLGAEVTGFALPPPTKPSLFDEARVSQLITHIEGDVREIETLSAAVAAAQPEVVFHLAAQPLVRLSYAQPVETYATNIMGTVNVLEAIRQAGGVKATIAITTDKCYDNREWVWPYRECDALGGNDPYSSSKAAAELVIAAYRQSFFVGARLGLASVRAGNVIGGGDWADDRLIPDLIRAFEAGKSPEIRSPDAVRPWQHVVDALGGYLLIAERLLAGKLEFAEAWNFGPSDEDAKPVAWIVDRMRRAWGGETLASVLPGYLGPHEAGLLRLDCSKARSKLGWQPALSLEAALGWIVEWHQALSSGVDAREITLEQITKYQKRANHLIN